MTKILSIGNSFSQDAQKYLHRLCAAAGVETYCVNLYIGGCSIEQHWGHAQDGEAAYDYEVNSVCERKISLADALVAEDWDIVTFQQASVPGGIPNSYRLLPDLMAFVRERCPKAKFYIHETWAYDEHPYFEEMYLGDQRVMFECICASYRMAERKTGAQLIPVGEIIQHLRDNEPFFADRRITRDGFHLSLGYGRYTAALTWYGVLFGGDVKAVDFVPDDPEEPVKPEILERIKETVAVVLAGR